MDTNTFNATFWLSICGILSGVLALVFTAINKSKCKEVSCCFDAFKCVRDTEAEVELEEHKIDHNIPESPINNNNNNLNLKI